MSAAREHRACKGSKSRLSSAVYGPDAMIMLSGKAVESSSIASGPPFTRSRCVRRDVGGEAALGSSGGSKMLETANSFPVELIPFNATICPGKN